MTSDALALRNGSASATPTNTAVRLTDPRSTPSLPQLRYPPVRSRALQAPSWIGPCQQQRRPPRLCGPQRRRVRDQGCVRGGTDPRAIAVCCPHRIEGIGGPVHRAGVKPPRSLCVDTGPLAPRKCRSGGHPGDIRYGAFGRRRERTPSRALTPPTGLPDQRSFRRAAATRGSALIRRR